MNTLKPFTNVPPLNIAKNGQILDDEFDELLKKKSIFFRSMFVEYATIIPKKRALLQEMGRVVGNKQAFAVEDLAALVEQGSWKAEELIDELNSLVRKNFLAYAPPRAEYALQGRSMELGLEVYVKMIGEGRKSEDGGRKTEIRG